MAATIFALGVAPLQARELTPMERETRALIDKITAGSISDSDILGVTFSIRLRRDDTTSPDRPGIAGQLSQLKGCSSTGVLQRDNNLYEMPADRLAVEAVIDCSQSEADPMLVRVLVIYTKDRMDYVVVSRSLQLG